MLTLPLPDLSDEATQCLFAVYLVDGVARRYRSTANDEAILQRVKSYGVTPSETACRRAIAELLQENRIQRVDGGNAATDEAADRAREQARIDRIANQPLTQADFDFYARLNPYELETKYYGDPVFAARYQRACKEWGFRIPAKSRNPIPGPVRRTTATLPTEEAAPVTLTVAEYHSLPVAVVQARFKRDPAFRAAVQKLIDDGRI